jgi:ubiquinone/menaquinone biosynthesis C-methylase UbiE
VRTAAHPYDAAASVYDSLWSEPKDKADDAEMVKRAGVYGRTLDIGCGTGLLLDHVMMEPGQYLGIDPSAGMLEEFRRRHPDHHAVQTPLESLHLNEYVDCVVSLWGSMSYVPPDVAHRAKRFLRKGGTYFLMFFKPGYEPQTHVRTGIEAPYWDFMQYKMNGIVEEYGDYVILRGVKS